MLRSSLSVMVLTLVFFAVSRQVRADESFESCDTLYHYALAECYASCNSGDTKCQQDCNAWAGEVLMQCLAKVPRPVPATSAATPSPAQND
jgi:hypothetical protein